MLSPKSRTLAYLSLVVLALGAAGDLVLVTAQGSQAPGWAHWWCSASGLHTSAPHGQATAGLVGTMLGFLEALAPHWPHILPIFVALGTLVYLRRANARFRGHEARMSVGT
jgi:hypothetical protein